MVLSSRIRKEITELLIATVSDKLKTYQPETVHMPFHHRLLGKDRYAIFSFIQSMNTTFGMSIWEQVAVILARSAGYIVERQYELLGEINEEAEKIISEIHFNLRKGEINPRIEDQISQIRANIKEGEHKKDPDSIVDLYIGIKNTDNYIDITTAKPNMKDFVALKLKLLRWAGLRLSQDKESNPIPRLAIPYNPYHPQPYERWTLK